MPNVRILVHRDRDYLTDYEIISRDTFRRIDNYFFVTKGTDIELSLNSMHVNYCHPSVSEVAAQKLVQDASRGLSKSVDYLRKKDLELIKQNNTLVLTKQLKILYLIIFSVLHMGKRLIRFFSIKSRCSKRKVKSGAAIKVSFLTRS